MTCFLVLFPCKYFIIGIINISQEIEAYFTVSSSCKLALNFLIYFVELVKISSHSGLQTMSGLQLIVAAQEGRLQEVRSLLEQGASLDLQIGAGCTDALLLASDGEHLEVVRLLLESGASVVLKTKDGWR